MRAAITGLGAVSAFGAGAERLWQALLAGERGVRPNALFERVGLGAGVLACVPEDVFANAGGSVPRPDRSGQRVDHGVPDEAERARASRIHLTGRMALMAAQEAAADAGGLVAGDALGVVMGTTLGGIGPWLEALAGRTSLGWEQRMSWSRPAFAVAEALGAGGPVTVCSAACASGNVALGTALGWLRSGQAVQVLVGGADALSDFVVAGFGSLKALDGGPCRPFDARRCGLNLGEGACFLVLETEDHARARGARIRGYLGGYGNAADAHHMTGPDRQGRGAARAMAAALADAGATPDDVDFVSAHGTATPFNDLMEARALESLLERRAGAVPVNSIKGAMGHTLGAAGVFEALVGVRAMESGWIPMTVGLEERDTAIALDVVMGTARQAELQVVLSTSSGFGGVNAAVVLQRADSR